LLVTSSTRQLARLAVGALLAAACTASDTSTNSVADDSTPDPTSAPSSPADPDEIDQRFGLPPEARATTGGGDPRPPAYWAVWNTCAPDNRADEAVAGGGRAAGYVLVDDVLANPGVALGDHLLTGCEESLALLEGRTAAGADTPDPAFALARQLLTAELNLNAGAETCPAAEEAVIGAQIVLATSGFDAVSTGPFDAETTGALPELVDLLVVYNTGGLCR
jgi:hypothetical protein